MTEAKSIKVSSGRLEVLPDGHLVISDWHMEGGPPRGDQPTEAWVIGMIIEFLQMKRDEALAANNPAIEFARLNTQSKRDVE